MAQDFYTKLDSQVVLSRHQCITTTCTNIHHTPRSIRSRRVSFRTSHHFAFVAPRAHEHTRHGFPLMIFISCDFSAALHGVHGALNKTFPLGRPFTLLHSPIGSRTLNNRHGVYRHGSIISQIFTSRRRFLRSGRGSIGSDFIAVFSQY